MPAARPIEDRIAEKFVVAGSGCWEWTARLNACGYGTVKWNGKSWLAHRAAYTLAVGTIPDGMELDHLCRNRACINPDHLEPVTHKQNMERADFSQRVPVRKPHCKRGHPWSGVRKNGRNVCHTCKNESTRRSRANQRAAA